MKAASLPNLNRETTSFPNFFSLYQDVDHDEDMTLNERPNIDHGDDTEPSEMLPFNDILSLSPLVSSNEIGFSAAPRSVMMFCCESERYPSSVGSNQFSCDSGGARSEGTTPTQMDYYQQPQISDSQQNLRFSHPSQQPKQSDFPGHVGHTPTSNQLSTAGSGAWAPPPPQLRLRIYTKVYKRGSLVRSIDITRYSGYEELKQDLARIFGIEGELEDGWKIVYVDHESDVLLLGVDPWEEFVCCVYCIKILSQQEVQEMNLESCMKISRQRSSILSQVYASSLLTGAAGGG
ncbi:hypothetical protein Vadar_020879 [Vaccinium darrowii]|uniref:Uncharacterized protein n=1 Tax=Vaccinium darrowii TaxID=229202 RepID=A0ACB7Y851_9ERIC|nr:hypothetical protein Vadar_020879 [Vaccinium darrowii]